VRRSILNGSETDLTRSTRTVGDAPKLAIAVICLAGALQGCVPKPAGQAGPRLPVYAFDQGGGARSCTVAPVSPVAGKQVEATMSVVNDGGWCAVTVQQEDKTPYTAGLVTARPKHGKVFVHSVGANTRIDYTPAAGFAGPDEFSIKLLPGDAVIAVAATVKK
jgi:hypothetical protein